MVFNETMKRNLIETAQKLYRDNFEARCEEDIIAKYEVDINTFKEACEDMSYLIYYLAEKIYNIPVQENKIYRCTFRYNEIEASHYFNLICGNIVDSTIMQFNNLSPYDNHDECYTDLEEYEYCEVTIKREIEYWKKNSNRVALWIGKLVSYVTRILIS